MQVSPNCFAVTGLAYVPPWCVNAGFIVGRHTTVVVDTGASALAAATIHGYAATARPNNRLIVVNTEQHFDHIGGNGYFRERGIDVYGHAGIERTDAEFRAEIAEFSGQISNPVRRDRGEQAVFYAGTSLANPNRPIHQDMTMDLGDCTVEILLTPGHTPTNVSLCAPGSRSLLRRLSDRRIYAKPRLRDEGRMATVACLSRSHRPPRSGRRCARARPSRDGKGC